MNQNIINKFKQDCLIETQRDLFGSLTTEYVLKVSPLELVEYIKWLIDSQTYSVVYLPNTDLGKEYSTDAIFCERLNVWLEPHSIPTVHECDATKAK